MPAEFLREGTLFMNRCTSTPHPQAGMPFTSLTTPVEPDKKEFIRISQAVGIGFLIMGEWRVQTTTPKTTELTTTAGVIGYIVKLVHIPVNNILVGGS
jgi:protein transport protein SEC61 subunit gamma-like protein